MIQFLLSLYYQLRGCGWRTEDQLGTTPYLGS
jgi:hypothetical protein